LYRPVWDKSTWDEAMWELANQNSGAITESFRFSARVSMVASRTSVAVSAAVKRVVVGPQQPLGQVLDPGELALHGPLLGAKALDGRLLLARSAHEGEVEDDQQHAGDDRAHQGRQGHVLARAGKGEIQAAIVALAPLAAGGGSCFVRGHGRPPWLEAAWQRRKYARERKWKSMPGVQRADIEAPPHP